MLAQILIVSSTVLMLILGILHLQGSFFLFDTDLEPRDSELKAQMKRVALNISPTTNMWRAWIGFNAMFALGLLLFGLVFGYLALFKFSDLTDTPFLLVVGGLYLASLIGFSHRYLFLIPAAAFALCLVLYGAGAVGAFV